MAVTLKRLINDALPIKLTINQTLHKLLYGVCTVKVISGNAIKAS